MGQCTPREVYLVNEISNLEGQLSDLRRRFDTQAARLAEVVTQRNNLQTALSSALARAQSNENDAAAEVQSLTARLTHNSALLGAANEGLVTLRQEQAATQEQLGAARQALADERAGRWMRDVVVAVLVCLALIVWDTVQRYVHIHRCNPYFTSDSILPITGSCGDHCGPNVATLPHVCGKQHSSPTVPSLVGYSVAFQVPCDDSAALRIYRARIHYIRF